MILNQFILAGRSMPMRFFFPNFIFILVVIIPNSELLGQQNYFEDVVITPSVCDQDDGTITIDNLPNNIDFIWDDSTTTLNRDNLPPGKYSISGEDEDGCIETIILEVPDISDCEVELETFSLPSTPYPNSSRDDNPVPPCVVVSFAFTMNGVTIPFSQLNILWTVTAPVAYPPYLVTYQSTQPTVYVYTSGTIIDLEVSLGSEYGEIPCCSLTDKITITNPCPVITPPKVFVYKSIFRDDQNLTTVPGIVELLVYGDGTCGGTTDIRGYILDDNNGELIPPLDTMMTNGDNLNIDPGYIQFSDDSTWLAVPNGSIITLYEPGHSLNASVDSIKDPTDSNQDFNYILSIENSTYLKGYSATWAGFAQAYYPGTISNPSWSLIETNGKADAIQVRYPNGDYCHGFSYGKTDASLEENYFPLYLDNTQRPYCQIHMDELSYLNKSAFNVIEVTGGFSPGQIGSQSMIDMTNYLRNCISFPLSYSSPNNSPTIEQTPLVNLQETETVSEKNSRNTAMLSVFPNPFKQFLEVEFKSKTAGTGNIRVFDSQGRLMEMIEVQCNGQVQNLTLDFKQKYVNGLFIIIFQSPDTNFISKKAVLLNTD